MSWVYFITHPDVLIDPAVAITEWKLSPRGRQRTQALLDQPWVSGLGEIWCSTEQKAIETAGIIAGAGGAVPREHPALGENDRSATGYLPGPEFEATAGVFFATPAVSVRGWERAVDAQCRIVAAVTAILSNATTVRDIAVVSHGGVGALLLCHLKRCAISRSEDQPGNGGGNYFCFDRTTYSLRHGWRPFEHRGS